ncbi:MAG: SDR family oxidoreductase [Aquisalinus sp.]|nr:SDR family oxidoreductase [Aquisalinus sp.]
MLDFSGKTVLVTGAATGIGAACAETFARQGANVVLADINEKKNIETATDVASKNNVETLPLTCDVASDISCVTLVEEAEKKFGQIDVLINNAGTIRTGNILDLDVSDFDKILGINLRSCFVLTQLVARQMVAKKIRGSIINMSSLNSMLAIPDQVAYVTSKGGLQQLTKASALGLAEHGIRVNAIGPGSVMTDILKVVMDDAAARKKILSRTPLGRVGDTAEVASVALFLASDMASYITGQTIFPDGGRSALNYTVPVNA